MTQMNADSKKQDLRHYLEAIGFTRAFPINSKNICAHLRHLRFHFSRHCNHEEDETEGLLEQILDFAN